MMFLLLISGKCRGIHCIVGKNVFFMVHLSLTFSSVQIGTVFFCSLTAVFIVVCHSFRCEHSRNSNHNLHHFSCFVSIQLASMDVSEIFHSKEFVHFCFHVRYCLKYVFRVAIRNRTKKKNSYRSEDSFTTAASSTSIDWQHLEWPSQEANRPLFFSGKNTYPVVIITRRWMICCWKLAL